MATTEVAKRIILATYGSPGDVRPFVAIGLALRSRGHRATIATSEQYRELVTAVGLEFAPVRPHRVPGQPEPDFFARLVRGRQPPAAIFREMFLPALRDAYTDSVAVAAGADGVVAHTLAPGAKLAAEAAGVPWVSAVMQPMGFFSAYEPPVLGPPPLAALLRRAGPGAARRVFRLARRLTAAWASEWPALRAELGLPPSDAHPLWEGQHAPGLTLGLFPHVLGEPQPDWPPQARVTGFPFFATSRDALTPDLEAFLADGPPPLVFTLGTTAINDPGRYFEISAAAARALGQRAVLVAGRAVPSGPVADGIVAVAYAPHHLLFPRAAAVVHQGGIGTLAEALRAGVPSLIVPYAHDQADNAWRARRLGVARVISRRRYREAAVRRELAALLQDRAMAATARFVSRRMAREHGAERAAELIVRALGC
jgi:UDP:flavonoid glycosyltransferase YjiC (YdhE family)